MSPYVCPHTTVVSTFTENNGEGGINRGIVAAAAAAIIAVIVSLLVVYHIKRRNSKHFTCPTIVLRD